MRSIWTTRTIEAAIPATNLSARPRRVVAHFKGLLGGFPITVVDVGSRGGIPGELTCLVPHINLVSIEPDPDEAARLNEGLSALGFRSAVVLPTAVGPSSRQLALHITRDPGKSSLLEPNETVIRRYAQEEEYEVIRRVPVTLRGLGDILAEQGRDEIDVLKLDVQGFELEILKTLSDQQLDTLLMIEVGCQFVELYKGASLFRHIDDYLSARGFELFHLCRIVSNYLGRRWGPYGRGQLQFGDAYYLRTRVEPLPASQIAKLIVLSAFYGFNDYGYYQFTRHRARLRELDGSLFRRFREYFAPFSATSPSMRRRLATGLRLVLDRFLFAYLAWRRWNGLKTDTDRAYPIR